MASSSRNPGAPLTALLRSEPYRFRFFQAVRLLLREHRARQRKLGAADGSSPAVWFRSHASLSFSPSEVVAVEPGAGARDVSLGAETIMTVAFMGLAGHDGALPDHYTELLLERMRARDPALQAFLNIFNHRLVQLFYDAWEKHRFFVPLERGDDDPLSQILYALLGLGTPRLRRTTGLQTEGLLPWAGVLFRKPVSLEVARLILSQRFDGVGIDILPFAGRWLELDPASRSVLGTRRTGCRLSRSAPLGRRIWDVQGRVKVRVGPLTREQLLEFSPGGQKGRELTDLLSFLVGGELEVETELVLAPESSVRCQLGGRGLRGAQLGTTSWLGRAPAAPVRHRERQHRASAPEDAARGSTHREGRKK